MRQLRLILGLSLALLAGRSALAGDRGVCQASCPNCDHVCELKIDKEGVKKHCWNVEHKPICIPKVTFPWQRNCCDSKSGKDGKGGCCIAPQNGAKLKYVRVLIKHEYECERCKYKFTPVSCGGCDGKYDGGKPAAVDNSPADVPADPPEVRGVYGTPVIPVVEMKRTGSSLAR